MEMLPRAEPHVINFIVRHDPVHLLAGVLARYLPLERLGPEEGIHQYAHILSKLPMRVAIVRHVKHWVHPVWLGIGYPRQIARLRSSNSCFLVNPSYGQALVLRSEEDF